MATYYVSPTASNVGVKEGDFFVSQGGLKEPWGKHWQKVEACCLYDARRKGIAIRREKFPDAHETIGEGKHRHLRTEWPEGYEGCCS